MPKIVDHDLQRRELSATVVDVVAQQGLENTTLRSVAQHHGCTKGMVQHYFADKEELLLAALAFVEDCCSSRMIQPEDRVGLDLLQARFFAQLPLEPEILKEWQVRLAFGTRAATSADMRFALTERQALQEKMAVSCLRTAQKMGELKAGLNLRNSYRSLNALVFGLAVGAVLSRAKMTSSVQRQILKTAIDDLRC